MNKVVAIVLAVLAITGGLTIGLLNPEVVDLDFLWLQLKLPVGAAIWIGFLLGVLVGIAWTLIWRSSRLVAGKLSSARKQDKPVA